MCYSLCSKALAQLSMKTASYFTFFGPGRIGITAGTPRRTPAGYRMYRSLAPRRDMLRLPYKPFREIYIREVLDPRKVVEELHELACRQEPVLLCFECPPLTATNWCHRRIAAEWFNEQLGLDVPELGPDS